MRTIISKSFVILILFFAEYNAQNNLLQSGPMAGYSTMRAVALWLQTTEEANVYFDYWSIDNPENVLQSAEGITDSYDAYTLQIVIDELEPGTTYEYRVNINDELVDIPYKLQFKTQELWQWRHDPPAIQFVIGSCLYINETEYDRPGEPYGGNYEILDHIYAKSPEFMVWMGDNTYLREVDWSARNSVLARNTHTRSTPKLQPLLGSTHHYATWDDHDYGPNNSDRSWWNKETTLEAFKLFWANPSYGVMGQEGVTTFFQWGDIDFYMLDDRYYRSPENRTNVEREILGNTQVEWLIDALTSSWAPFKFIVIGTQFLNPNAGGENHSMYPAERKKILDAIQAENIPGVIFLTGDVHRSEVTKIERQGTYPLYEFTISPLTAGPSSRVYPNDARIAESLLVDRNFGYFEVTGPRRNRVLTLTIIDWQGNEHYSISINENELK